MHVDHLVFAASPSGLLSEAERLGAALGCTFRDGGFHPRFGTRNHILPLADDRYLELVEVLEHPAAEKAPFGQAVRARTQRGGGWMGWVVSVDDLAPYETRLSREAVAGARRFPDGRLLEWDQIGIRDLIRDPELPYFLKWRSESDVLPSALPSAARLVEFEIAGSRSSVEDWLGEGINDVFDGVRVTFAEPGEATGIISATFECPNGIVRI
jgi:hypothetical protein